jgi:hypothetical protein
MQHKIILYLGNTELGDVNSLAKNRYLVESLKSEAVDTDADQFTFDINRQQYIDFIKKRFDDNPDSFLRPLKLRVVFVIDGLVRFSGDLASRPARSGFGSDQILTLKFNEKFWRLSGDLVCDPKDPMQPYRRFENVPAHVYVKSLIDEAKARFAAAGDPLNWDYGVVNTLGNKSFTYTDFPTIAKALCDAMDNNQGAGKFDVVVRTDPSDYTHCFVDILRPRGKSKNIMIQYPSDGVYSLWSTDYVLDETNDFAHEVVVSGAGGMGPDSEMSAPIAGASNLDFAEDYGYFRWYSSESNLESQAAVNNAAQKLLEQRDFSFRTPQIKLVGRPIIWGDAENEDNGLAIGDSFYFMDESDSGVDQSGFFRIKGLETSYDENGVATVAPTLIREE